MFIIIDTYGSFAQEAACFVELKFCCQEGGQILLFVLVCNNCNTITDISLVEFMN